MTTTAPKPGTPDEDRNAEAAAAATFTERIAGAMHQAKADAGDRHRRYLQGLALDVISELTTRPKDSRGDDVIEGIRSTGDRVWIEETVSGLIYREQSHGDNDEWAEQHVGETDYNAVIGMVFSWLHATHGIPAPIWWVRETDAYVSGAAQ